jgi:hypothetical protein
MDRDGNRRILWEHFQDVVWLLFLEGGLVAGVELLDRVFPALRSSWQVLHTLLIWSAIATVAQFALISFLAVAGA